MRFMLCSRPSAVLPSSSVPLAGGLLGSGRSDGCRAVTTALNALMKPWMPAALCPWFWELPRLLGDVVFWVAVRVAFGFVVVMAFDWLSTVSLSSCLLALVA